MDTEHFDMVAFMYATKLTEFEVNGCVGVALVTS